MGPLTVFDAFAGRLLPEVGRRHQLGTSADEGNDYAVEFPASGHTLVFGRKSYEMTARFWPTEQTLK